MIKTYWEHKKIKHINVYHHFIKEKIETREFKLVYTLSNENSWFFHKGTPTWHYKKLYIRFKAME